MARKKYQFAHLIVVTLVLTIHESLSKNSTRSRTVFPFDVVKFACAGSHQQITRDDIYVPDKERCTWTFFTSPNETVRQTGDCFRRENVMTKGHIDELEGYVEVPEKADAFSCAGNDGKTGDRIPVFVHHLKLASDTAIRHPRPTPIILLQRFSKDFGVRLGAHDVTNQEVIIDGEEVDSIKLSCISVKPLEWTDITMNKQRVIKELEKRDKDWLLGKSPKVDKKFEEYVKFLLDSEQDSIERMNSTRSGMGMEEVIYTLPLTIRLITNKTSRTYECRSMEDKMLASNVTVRVENPQKVGPDEIAMIQQIVSILDSLAQSKGGGQSWYSFASLLSIILILFMYYCRMKLQQGSQQQQQNQCIPKPPDEETEIRTRLQSPSQNQNHTTEAENPVQEQGPSSIVSEQPKKAEQV